MIERVAILGVLAVVLALGVVLTRAYAARRMDAVKAAPRDPLWASLGEQPDGRPTLVSFSTPSCAACHRAQAPAVSRVEEQLGAHALRVISVNTAERPEVARAFGVMTVPSTVVLAEAGHVVAINQGFAPSVKLIQQVQGS
jgi:thioredoxin-like negative regulator of GroEL